MTDGDATTLLRREQPVLDCRERRDDPQGAMERVQAVGLLIDFGDVDSHAFDLGVGVVANH